MVFESESYKIKNLEKGSTIFLDKKLSIDELDSTRSTSPKGSFSQDVINIFHTLKTQYNLVLVEEKSREKATYTHLHSLLKESGIPFLSISEEVNKGDASLKNKHTTSSVVSHFCREHGITDDKNIICMILIRYRSSMKRLILTQKHFSPKNSQSVFTIFKIW